MKGFIRKKYERAVFTLLIIILSSGISNAQDEIKLIIRGDDMGMTQGSLVAFEKAMNEGVLTCASIQVPAPWFEGAAELCRKNPGWCTGVHLTLIGEWRGYPWRPVLPWDKVSSLVDEDGYFYRYPKELHAHKPKLEEIDAELRAQIDLAIKKGIDVQYLDVHYWSTRGYPGADEVVKKIASDYKLPISESLGEKEISIYSVPAESKKDSAIKMLDEIGPGLYLWVCHPGIDSPEQHALIHTSPEDIMIDGGNVGLHRTMVTNTLTSVELKSIILKRNIKLTDYRKLWADYK
jgi:predicted glycoside hydrolase/deacetylase ChbG (UPF0249 family)